MMFAPMELLPTLEAVDPEAARRPVRGARSWNRTRARLRAFAAGACLLAAPGLALQDSAPDQVFRTNTRTGKVTKVLGVVTQNSLEAVKVLRDDKEQSIDAAEVVDIVWGSLPADFRDGQTYASRSDWENAVAHFRAAAGDSDVRDVLRAASRLQAAEGLLAWGGQDANHFRECSEECAKFLADYPQDRNVPRAEWLRARAVWLAGDAKTAADQFRALYEKNGTAGYDQVTCLEAGLSAAQAALAAGDAVTARTLFPTLENGLTQAAASLAGEDAALRARLLRQAGEASVGEGFCMLAGSQAREALSYFRGKRDGAQEAGARSAATLGLAEAHVALGQLREAQLEFAKVSALEYANEDRIARSLVGLAEVTLQLADSDAKAQAKLRLQKVLELYGATPSAAKAAELLKKL